MELKSFGNIRAMFWASYWNIFMCYFFRLLLIHVLSACRYLCDFIFYSSMLQDKLCSAFIHVPPLNQPYTAEQLASGIREAIKAMLKQVLPA
jgi:hypothetical protein